MSNRAITDEAFADLLDEATVDHRGDLGAIMVTTGQHPALGAFCVTQTTNGFSIVAERDTSFGRQ